ncbi:hypothetical protein IMW82_08220 [Rhodanobacter sp. B2A1Ga4]|uniref:hypothetical protein n=1 Tax=Rhodanobacter TaxID=75309 RepID=UPI00131EFB5B|nr:MULTISPECIES: hypothetical protein [Rhodanobacter]MBQ4854653.1 hypothetical protein [Rhodanobacter sp. B2A1Ga4]
MPHERYNPIPLNIPATKNRWSKNPAFAETYNALADEFPALGHCANAVGCELHSAQAPKPKASRRNLPR